MSVLESFVILFQSDSKEVKQGADIAKKSTDELAKSLKSVSTLATSAGEKLKNLAREYGSMLVAAASVGAIIQGVRNAAAYANELAVASEALGVSTEALDTWGGAVKKSGGTAEGFRASVQSMNDSLGQLALHGTSATLPFFQRLGIRLRDANGHLKDTMTLLPEIATAFEGMSWAKSLEIGKGLGLDVGTISLLVKGRREVETLIKRQKELGVVTQRDADIARKFNEQWEDTGHAFRGLFTVISSMFLPAITSVLKGFENVATYFQKHGPLIEGILIAIGTAIAVFVLPPLIAAAASALALYWPILLIIGVVTALGAAFALAYDDIVTFMNGGNSLIGEMLKKWPVIGEIFNDISKAIKASVAAVMEGIASVVAAYEKVKSFLGFGGDTKVAVEEAKRAISISANSPLAAQTSSSIANNNSKTAGDRNTSVQTGPITIQTQATDSDQIAGAIGNSMRDQLRLAVNNFDDGVAA